MTAPLDVILNASSGPSRTDRDAIQAAFGRHGITVRVHERSDAQDLDTLLDAVCAHSPRCVVAAGGDGTVNAVAARLAGTDAVLGVLPLGTLNHFARDLGIPPELDAAAAVIAQAMAADAGASGEGAVREPVVVERAAIEHAAIEHAAIERAAAPHAAFADAIASPASAAPSADDAASAPPRTRSHAPGARLAGATAPLSVVPRGSVDGSGGASAPAATHAPGRRVRVDVADVNGRVFLNNASIGLYATMVAHREDAQRRLALGKWPAMVRAIWAALRHPTSFDVAVEADGQTRHWRTPFLFVGNNVYTVQGPALGQRARLDEGCLSFYVLHPKGTWALVWLGLRALVGAMSGGDDLDALRATALCVHGARDRVRVAHDGEVTELAMPLQFRLRPRALRVCAPQPAPEAR